MVVEGLRSSADYYHPGQLRRAAQFLSFRRSKLAVPLEHIRRRAAAEAHDGVEQGVIAIHQAIQSPYS